MKQLPRTRISRLAVLAAVALGCGNLLLALSGSLAAGGNGPLRVAAGVIAIAASAVAAKVAAGWLATPFARAERIASSPGAAVTDGEIDALAAQVMALAARLDVPLSVERPQALPSMFEQRRELFLSVVGDELRAPLREIGATASGLLASGRLSAPQSEDVTLILSGCGELLGLVEMVLAPASGDGEVHHEDVDLGTLVREVARAQRPTVEEKGIALSVEVEGEVSAWGDPRRLRQVVTNLAANAVKFTDAGTIRIAVRRSGGWIEVEVRDQGPGIAEAEMGRLFQPYEQLGSEPQKGRGTGLGLSIARRIVEEHGGTLTVASRVGEGSVFAFRIPATHRRTAAPPEPQAQSNEEPA